MTYCIRIVLNLITRKPVSSTRKLKWCMPSEFTTVTSSSWLRQSRNNCMKGVHHNDLRNSFHNTKRSGILLWRIFFSFIPYLHNIVYVDILFVVHQRAFFLATFANYPICTRKNNDFHRAVARTLIGGGGGYINIFELCPTNFFWNQLYFKRN